MPTPEPTRPTDMVGKALALLTELGEYPQGVVASELARQCGFPLSTAHRLLGALVRDGFAAFDKSTKRYTLGLRVFQLAQSVSHAQGFTGLARPILEQVSAATREATLLAVLDGDQQLYVYSIGGPQQVSVVGEPGRRYLWILSREPQMDTALYQEIVERAMQRGFDTGKLLKTRQAS